MRLTPTLGRVAPRPAVTRLADDLKEVKRSVKEGLASAGELTSAVIRRGLLRITDHGGFVIDGVPLGSPTASFEQYRWGAMADDPRFNRPDGSQQMAFLAYRDDLTLALSIAELRADDGQYSQALILWDRAGNIIVSEDTNSGNGLARPHIPWSTPQPTNTAQWLTHSPAAGDTSWTSIARVEVDPDNPRMWWNVRTLVDAGVTAEYRWCFQLDAGVQAPVLLTASGTTAVHANTAGGTYNFGYWRETNVPFPSGVFPQRRTTLDLQVRMTVGADGAHVAKASVVALGGDQS